MIELESMAVAMPEVVGHPNRAGFRGVLTMVDVPSKRAPSGSGGRRVVLTRAAAEAALPSLLGMALDYAPSFDRHDMRRKVGVITSAEIVGRNLEVGGYLYARDFPEVVEEIAKSGGVGKSQNPHPFDALRLLRAGSVAENATRVGQPASGKSEGVRLRAALAAAVDRLRSWTSGPRRAPGPDLRAEAVGAAGSELGMSYEVTDVVLADRRARVWTLTKVTFTGAAILRRTKAAYEETWIELS
jgi:hypothetical protein